ncbi:hypothetical protein OG393_13940 [Streptomyces sp. NBC_01216]|uniref:hypothetical protein n=1 Tax=Streptomyces sp. NBC_01216 TaxID=2903778 RepID=UPI002E159D4C|nr:hypothetical protein OG393_13940 [Streptomyces sp. NBC_01216]
MEAIQTTDTTTDGPEDSVAAVDSGGPPEATPPRTRRTGRTVALIAVAAVLGLVGGTAVGYGVQAQREPTALPALNQPGLAYPKPLPKGGTIEPLSATEDRAVKTNGDLRKLLLPKPAGAKKTDFTDDDGWVTLPEYADDFNHPGRALGYQLESGIRRIAATSWKTGQYRVTEIRLVQYRPSDVLGSRDHAEEQMSYMADDEYAENEGVALKGSANGRFYVFPVKRKAGYLDFYEARAYLSRGDIAVEVFMFDTKKISKKDISSVAERQLGRL